MEAEEPRRHASRVVRRHGGGRDEVVGGGGGGESHGWLVVTLAARTAARRGEVRRFLSVCLSFLSLALVGAVGRGSGSFLLIFIFLICHLAALLDWMCPFSFLFSFFSPAVVLFVS